MKADRIDTLRASPGSAGVRCGFTLLEVLLAVILIDVGLFALVAGSAVLVRQTSELHARDRAARTAANRVQALGAGPCAPLVGQARSADGQEERWMVVLIAGGARDVSDSVGFVVRGVPRSVVLRTRLSC